MQRLCKAGQQRSTRCMCGMHVWHAACEWRPTCMHARRTCSVMPLNDMSCMDSRKRMLLDSATTSPAPEAVTFVHEPPTKNAVAFVSRTIAPSATQRTNLQAEQAKL